MKISCYKRLELCATYNTIQKGMTCIPGYSATSHDLSDNLNEAPINKHTVLFKDCTSVAPYKQDTGK